MASTSGLLTQLGLDLSKHKQMASAAEARLLTSSPPNVGLASDALAAALTAGAHLIKADHETAITKAVDAAIAARTGAQGDLVPKTTVDQLCSAAKDLGVKEGRAAEQADAAALLAAEKLATDRTAALTTAGLPLPEADVVVLGRRKRSSRNFKRRSPPFLRSRSVPDGPLPNPLRRRRLAGPRPRPCRCSVWEKDRSLLC